MGSGESNPILNFVIGLVVGVGMAFLYIRFGIELPAAMGVGQRITSEVIVKTAEFELFNSSNPALVRHRALAVILATDIIIFCLFAASLHFLIGLGGLVSFGHAAYFGGGAYVAALLVSHANTPMELAFLLAPLGAGFAAVIIGWLCIRLTGVYFAMLTLALAQLLWSLVFQWDEFTGGDDGMVDIWPAEWLSGTIAYFYFTMVFGIGAIIFLRHVAHSPFGYALRASRDSSRQAESTGINTKRVQWMAFSFAGAMAGIAGALFVFSKGSVFPVELEIARSFDGLIVVFLGGVKTLAGGVVGAASLELVKDYLTRFEYWRLALGILIIIVVILAPNGIVGSLRKLFAGVSLFGNRSTKQ